MIVPLRDEHIRECASIMVNNALWQHYGVTQADAVTQFGNGLVDDTVHIDISLHQQTVTGFVWYYNRGTFHVGGYIRLIAVHPNYQNQGIGTHLIEAAEASIAQHSDYIFLLSSDFNRAAHRLYHRLGYQAVGSLPDFAKQGIAELIFMKTLNRRKDTNHQ